MHLPVIQVTSVIRAVHWWPAAPPHRRYLSYPHAHDFAVTAFVEVDHGDRAIEFHDLQDRLSEILSNLSPIDAFESAGVMPSFGSRSCEQIAVEVLHQMPEAHRVRVMEDDQVGASVRRKDLQAPGAWRPTVWTQSPQIVTLCGSTRFRDEFRAAEARFEREGVCVFTVGFFAHADAVPIGEHEKIAADELHKWKILMSDFIFVVNPGGYIGESTASEIAFARDRGISITYLEAPA